MSFLAMYKFWQVSIYLHIHNIIFPFTRGEWNTDMLYISSCNRSLEANL